MRYGLFWGIGSVLVAGCGGPFPGTGGTGGQDASPPPQCVTLSGRYLATAGTVVNEPVDVRQLNCDVSAVVPGFGSVTCTAQPRGVMPRLTSCSLHVDECTVTRDYPATLEDDGTSFDITALTRWSACHGNSAGGTLLFALKLQPVRRPPIQ